MGCGSGAQRFAWRRWGRNGVVFDRRYGDTHTLTGAAAAVFEAWLHCGSVALDALIVAADLGHDGALLEHAALADALHELQQRGLLPLQ